MTTVKALDSKISLLMFLQGMGKRFQTIMARALTPEEKLAAIIAEMEKDVQEKRVLARQIGAQMRALSDPDTTDLEPLEAAKARRAKLVKLGGQNLENAERLGQIQHEVKALDTMIASQEATYATLKESYDLASANYKTALAALDSTRSNGPAILKAIKAHQDALAMRDKAKNTDAVDASFMDDLTAELTNAQGELRSDKAIDDDLDATKSGSLDAELAKMDASNVDDSLMAEFQAAAGKTTATSTFKVTVEPASEK